MADVLQRQLTRDHSPHAVAAQKMGQLLQKALAQTRGLARGLHPVAPEQGGFARALENLAAQSSELFGVHCDFEGESEVQIEDESATLHLYRIAQEAVSNAVKHGRARHIHLRLTRSALTITDDGQGLQTPAKTEGMGLRIMRYRAEMTGGRLRVENGPHSGVVVCCTLNPHLHHGQNPPHTRPQRKKARPHRR
jgi:signal transduction histidine kinase